MDGDSDAMRVAGTDPNEPRVDFAFVNISRPGYDWKNRNEYVVRSHAMRHVRRRQKAKTAVKIVHKVVDRNLHRAEVQADFTATPSSLLVRGDRSCEVEINNIPSKDQTSSRNIQDSLTKLDNTIAPQPEIYLQPPWNSGSLNERKLLSHIVALYSPLLEAASQNFVLWTKGVKKLMAIAHSHDFVMHAILAWSASHLSRLSGDTDILEQNYHYRIRAINGLQKAIDSFSSSNADAIVAASTIMSWQAGDAESWAIFIQGKSSVIDMIASSKYQSYLVDGIEHNFVKDKRALVLQVLRKTSSKLITPHVILKYALGSLKELRHFVEKKPYLSEVVDQLMDFVEDYRAVPPSANLQLRRDRLQPLRDMLFWVPMKFIPILGTDPAVLLVNSYVHAIALVVEPVKSANSAFFRGLNAPPISAFYEELAIMSQTGSVEEPELYEEIMRLMTFPLTAVSNFKTITQFLLDGEDPLALLMSPLFGLNYGRPLLCQCTSVLRTLEKYPVGLWHTSVRPE